MIYEAHYSQPLQVEALNPASTFSFRFLRDIKPPIRQVIKRIVTLNPQQQRFEFMGRHYTVVAQVLVRYYGPYFNYRL